MVSYKVKNNQVHVVFESLKTVKWSNSMSATSITQSVKTLQSNIDQHVHHRALRQNVGQPTLQEAQL